MTSASINFTYLPGYNSIMLFDKDPGGFARNVRHRLTLKRFPKLFAHAGLTEDSAQQSFADVAVMRVGDADRKFAPNHELMFATRERTDETQLSEAVNKVYSTDRPEMWH